MIKSKMKKKGVSPIIAVILLIALVVVIGLIVFIWMRGMVGEAIVKFDNENIEIVCERVSFDASKSGNTLTILNVGNVPIYSFEVILKSGGSHSTKEINELFSDWDVVKGFNSGATFSGELSPDDSSKEITLIPILMGENKDGEKKTAPCDKRHGFVIP